MKSKEIVKLELQLGAEQTETSLDKVASSITGLGNTIASVGSEISKLFETVQINADMLVANVQQIAAPIDQLSKSLNVMAALDFNSLITELNELKEVLNRIFEQMEEQQTQDLATSVGSYAFSAAELGRDISKDMRDKKSKSADNSKGGIKVKVRKKGTDSISSASGITAGGIGAAMGLDGDFGDLQQYDTLISLFSNLGSVVSDAGQKMRDFGSAIGSAFSNFGTTIAQLASSTGAWIANTAAKVGNTAAQWAQIAATTAWQAICAAATAVTTAFGAAMTFLTSPIGLVVVGITALIAIIVLLIANWDTVSAALAAGWDWLCTKIQEVAAFVQSIFAGIGAFLQDVFAKDWTEQFGAFGNVLNAFFANVENIWNAVKSIFSGIVSFVKNVFAGDWGAAWDSIVSVFKGIWDYLVAVVKAPINGIIGIINGLVQGVVDGINLVIRALNGIHFTIPDWIPGLGGMTVGFQIQPLNAPKIPYLARGAVLPANKPFLAVLGDQRHGNNIEAPEGLIRDIFKEEMGDFLGGMMAGFEALLAENRSLRAVVECIEVGDTTIGQAANRYNDKMAVVRGRA